MACSTWRVVTGQFSTRAWEVSNTPLDFRCPLALPPSVLTEAIAQASKIVFSGRGPTSRFHGYTAPTSSMSAVRLATSSRSLEAGVRHKSEIPPCMPYHMRGDRIHSLSGAPRRRAHRLRRRDNLARPNLITRAPAFSCPLPLLFLRPHGLSWCGQISRWWTSTCASSTGPSPPRCRRCTAHWGLITTRGTTRAPTSLSSNAHLAPASLATSPSHPLSSDKHLGPILPTPPRTLHIASSSCTLADRGAESTAGYSPRS